MPPALDAPRRARVASVKMSDERSGIVSFTGVDTIDIAEQLTRCHCLVRRSELSDDAFEEECFEWNGWEVYDVHAGLLGYAKDLEERPHQSLLLVAPIGFGGAAVSDKVILIPFVDEFIKSVDRTACRIDVAVPAGLLDL